MRIVTFLAVFAVAGLNSTTHAEPPNVFIKWSDSSTQLVNGSWISFNGTVWTRNITNVVQLTATDQGNGFWTLTVTNKKDATDQTPIVAIDFPYENPNDPNSHKLSEGDDPNDNIIYTPTFSGQAKYSKNWWNLWSVPLWSYVDGLEHYYPGLFFSPFIIIADSENSRIVSATTWPPIKCRPQCIVDSDDGIELVRINYPDLHIGYNASQQFGALRAWCSADPESGEHGWQLAAQVYRSWLSARLAENGGQFKPEYPCWMHESHGFINLDLMNQALGGSPKYGEVFAPYILGLADPNDPNHPGWFNHVQCWGQMSSQGGNCCGIWSPCGDPNNDPRTIHSRYLASGTFVDPNAYGSGGNGDLMEFSKAVRDAGSHWGYYTRPVGTTDEDCFDDDTVDFTDSGQVAWTVEWQHSSGRPCVAPGLDPNVTWNADVYYIDVLGGIYAGDPLTVASLFKQVCDPNDPNTPGGFPVSTIVEFPVDVYPTAFLISGNLGRQPNDTAFPGGPHCRLQDLTPSSTCAMFPRLASYVLQDHYLYSGESNDGWMWWGANSDPNYHDGKHWVERTAFLCGHKFDAQHPFVNAPAWEVDTPNPALKRVIELREAYGFWCRGVRYEDTFGIVGNDPCSADGIPDNVEIRRFVDRNGNSLFAIENWYGEEGVTFTFGGHTYDVPVAGSGEIALFFLQDCDDDGEPDEPGDCDSCERCEE